MAAAYVRRNAAATGSSDPDDPGSPGRAVSESPVEHEATHERITRNWNELLQELRVAQTGVQILTGFLLTVPFTQRFAELDDHQRAIYLAVLLGATLTTCLIVAPAAFHRMLFRQQRREWLVTSANVCARLGLACLALVSSAVVLLVFDLVVGLAAGLVASLLVLTTFAGVWFGTPWLAHR